MSTMSSDPLVAPFPWFGGKSRAADVVWQALGAVDNYVEPFAGSAAMLLACPHDPKVETINDADGFVANFWRAIKIDPEAAADAADWPCNEADLFARHSLLVRSRDGLLDRLHADPDWCDPRIAGWWAWGQCNWIGSGWCSGDGPWVHDGEALVDSRKLPHLGDAGMGINRKLPHLSAGQGINRKLPHLSAGQGINRQLPHLGDAGQGINRQLPHLGDAGKGINRQLPHLGDAGKGDRRAFIFDWFARLHGRLREVRVACGDWSRVVTDSVTVRHGMTGVFLDPPYTKGEMDYSAGGVGGDLARDVQAWAAANAANPLLRIVVCGHAGEHDALLAHGYTARKWTARKGYALSEEAVANAASETVWCSPACVPEVGVQAGLFA